MKRILSALLLVLMLTALLASCGSAIPEPEIKEGEFAFSVTYEYGGETETLSGVYVCLYNGITWSFDDGYHRDWIGTVQGDVTEDRVAIGTTDADEKVELSFAFYPEYFMGDPATVGRAIPMPYLSVTISDDAGLRILHDPADVEAYCGARILSYEYAQPIENFFELVEYE